MPTTSAPPRRARLALLTALLALLAPLALTVPADASTGAAGAWVRGAHLVPGLGTMTLALSPVSGSAAPDLGDAIVLAPTASYGDVAGYQRVPAGRYAVGVWPADSPRDAEPVLTGTVEVADGQAYTVAGLGTKDDPTVSTLSDDLTPAQPGAARVRVLPAASSAPTVDISAVGGPAVANGAAFGRPTGYSTVPAGAWTLSTSADGSEPTTTQVSLTGGGVYTLLVLEATQGLVVTAVVDAEGTASTPVGGAATGGGASADRATDLAPATTAAAGLALLLLAAGPARRRLRPAVAPHS
jgi:hypothetical protein